MSSRQQDKKQQSNRQQSKKPQSNSQQSKKQQSKKPQSNGQQNNEPRGNKQRGTEQKKHIDAIREMAEKVRGSNLFNDTFVSVALEDVEACEYVLRKILGMDDLKVIWVKGQYYLLNLTAKDSQVDVFAEDSKGRMMNIEIQRKDNVDHARRTRYYGSMIDKDSLEKGATYDTLPDVYIVYISETDLWGGGETVYWVKKTLGKAAIPYDDGRHVVYVNAAVNDGSQIAKMMQYFKTSAPDDMSQGALSRRVRYLKRTERGYQEMCEAAEKVYDLGVAQGREEGREEGIALGIKQGITKGAEEEKKKSSIRMYKSGLDIELIAYLQEATVSQVKEWVGFEKG